MYVYVCTCIHNRVISYNVCISLFDNMLYFLYIYQLAFYLHTCYNYYLIDYFQVGTVLCQLEYHKRHAIEREDYDEAKKWKVLIWL